MLVLVLQKRKYPKHLGNHKHIKTLWDFLKLNSPLPNSVDLIVGFGSYNTAVADYASELFFKYQPHYLVFSGGLGRITKEKWNRPEAEIFAEIAIEKGVPEAQLINETESTNTGENFRFTQTRLKENWKRISNILIVQKPYVEHRVKTTAPIGWPEKRVFITSPPHLTFDHYIDTYGIQFVGELVVGEVQRLEVYADRGYQVQTVIPQRIWDSYDLLVQNGFHNQIIPNTRANDASK